MSHRLGALLLPAPPPDSQSESAGDPGLDVLASAVSAVLTEWLGGLWAFVSPGEPVVRKVSTHDPQEVDFHSRDLPLLAVWREADTAPKRLSDGYQQTETLVRIAWVYPPATQIKAGKRHAFFAAFDKAINLLVLHERDAAWKHPSDLADPDPSSSPDEQQAQQQRRYAAEEYGSSVLEHAGFDGWAMQRVERGSMDIQVGSAVHRYPAYVASLIVKEDSETDPASFGGAYPFSARFDVKHRGETVEQGVTPPYLPPVPEDP